jgi:hypothetical protein
MSSSSYDYSTSDEEFGRDEDEDIALIFALHNNKWVKHGSSVIGHEKLWRARVDGKNWLMINYFVEKPVYPERYCCRRFRMRTELFQHITECVKLHHRFFEQRRNCVGEPRHNTVDLEGYHRIAHDCIWNSNRSC